MPASRSSTRNATREDRAKTLTPVTTRNSASSFHRSFELWITLRIIAPV